MSFYEENIEQDPDIARLNALSSSNATLLANLPLPVAAFVSALNGLTGALSLAGGTNSGLTISITPGVGSITISISGNGAMATKAAAAAVADSAVVASATYVQAEAQAVIDKLNALLQSLRTAGHIA